MKIIKRGTDPKDDPIQTICRKCSTVFEWTKGEGEYVSDQRDGDFYWIVCPVCQQRNSVSAHRRLG